MSRKAIGVPVLAILSYTRSPAQRQNPVPAPYRRPVWLSQQEAPQQVNWGRPRPTAGRAVGPLRPAKTELTHLRDSRTGGGRTGLPPAHGEPPRLANPPAVARTTLPLPLPRDFRPYHTSPSGPTRASHGQPTISCALVTTFLRLNVTTTAAETTQDT
jgi:hypothetical protein